MCSWLSFASFRPSLTSEIVLKELLCKRQQMKCFHLTKNEHIAYFYEYLSKLLISSFYLQCIYHIHHDSWFAHFLGHKMNCIPHLIPKNGVKLQENRVHPPPIFGGVKSREEPLFSHKKLLELSENKDIFL